MVCHETVKLDTMDDGRRRRKRIQLVIELKTVGVRLPICTQLNTVGPNPIQIIEI